MQLQPGQLWFPTLCTAPLSTVRSSIWALLAPKEKQIRIKLFGVSKILIERLKSHRCYGKIQQEGRHILAFKQLLLDTWHRIRLACHGQRTHLSTEIEIGPEPCQMWIQHASKYPKRSDKKINNREVTRLWYFTVSGTQLAVEFSWTNVHKFFRDTEI